MRRKPFSLVPLERDLLAAAVGVARAGVAEFHGYAIAREVADLKEARRLTGHGTLYRALDRMEQAGLLESSLEDADEAAAERRPRRRMYRLTAVGETTAAQEASVARPVATLRKGLATE